MDAALLQDLLALQRLDIALVRAALDHPRFMSAREYESLRYVLGLARLHRFAPGVAAGAPGRADVDLCEPALDLLRAQARQLLSPALRAEGAGPLDRLKACLPVVDPLVSAARSAREQLLARHVNDFSPEELDAEVTRKVLVLMPGGGGGSGFVYVGGMARLQAAGLVPAYVVGASIGALLGALYAVRRDVDLHDLLEFGKSLKLGNIFARPFVGATRSLPGLTRLHLQALDAQLRFPDGTPLRLSDLGIPYEALVAGLRKGVYEHLPEAARSVLASDTEGAPLAQLIAERMSRITDFFSPRLFQEIVLGRDADTRTMRAVDAVGLSAAIPGVLQYEPQTRDAQSEEILTMLAERHGLAAFVDGGVAANVPARAAWEGVQAGRIGTRNAFYLAWDCFHPQWGMGHVWLQPVTQAIQLQTRAQRPYLDWLLRFAPALSPVNLLPSAKLLDEAWQWGWEQADGVIPLVQAALQPVAWRP